MIVFESNKIISESNAAVNESDLETIESDSLFIESSSVVVKSNSVVNQSDSASTNFDSDFTKSYLLKAQSLIINLKTDFVCPQSITTGENITNTEKKFMPRSKKSPTKIMVDASERLAGLKSIDADFDLGNDLTAAKFKAKIDAIYGVLEEYNSLLSEVDQKSNAFDVLEKELRDLNERYLLAVAVNFGKDSDEYEMAGGKRKSERKKPTKKDNLAKS